MADVRVTSGCVGYDGELGTIVCCVDCGEELPGREPIDGWPIPQLVQLAEDHAPVCVPKPPREPEPAAPRWANRPVITPDPEPVLGERTIKLGERP